MPLLTDIEIKLAQADISKNLHKLAKKDIFGRKTKIRWDDVFCKYFIIDMLECTGGQHLDDCDLDCLKGKLSFGLKNNCC